MSLLARYKKGNAIMELVKLIEDSGEPKRSQLLNMVATEDAAFAELVKAKVLDFERVKTLPDDLIAEIVGSTNPKFLAIALCSESPAFVTLCEKCLGKAFNNYKVEKENCKSTPPTPNQIESAKRKIVADVRKLVESGVLKIPGLDTSSSSTAAASAASSSPSAPGAGPTAASNPAGASPTNPSAAPTGAPSASDSGCPPVEQFGLEAAPPGLRGERLETYLKNTLGF